MIKKALLFLVIVSLLIINSAVFAEDDVLRVHLYEDIQNLDPAFYPSDADESVFVNIYEGLMRFIPGTFEPENWLAEKLEFSEDGKDITFKLKEGVQFHGGYGELTSEDVKFSFERMIDPELNAVYGGDWVALDNVEITGTYSGIIHLKQAYAPIYDVLAGNSGFILSKKAGEELGVSGLAMHPIGTGPYQFTEWKPNQEVILTRFDGYYGEPKQWKEIHHVYIPEESSVEIALETGELDIGRISPSIVERFEGNEDFNVTTIQTLDWEFMPINTQHPLLKDVNIRKAIRSAIDVEAINYAVYEGRFAPLCNMLTPQMVGYWEEAPCYARDLDKAREYMAAAGVDSLTLDLAIQNTEDEKTVGEIIQANLADINITVNLNIQDDAAFVEEGFGPEAVKNRQLVYLNFVNFKDPGLVTYYFTCEQVEQWNWSYWCNEEFDALHNAALYEMDQAKREAIYLEMQKIVDEEVPMVFVGNITMNYVSVADINPVFQPQGRILPYMATAK